MAKNNLIAIISDVHANYTALETVLNEIKMLQINDIICLGDLVGYNPEPEKTVKKIREVCSEVIAGNHDRSMVEKIDKNWFRGTVQRSIDWTKSQLSQSSLDYLKKLKTRNNITIEDNKILLAHGSPEPETPFRYVFNPSDIKLIEPFIMNTDILFIGHTHIPFCYYNRGNGWVRMDQREFEINPEYNYVINVGSVGQPRDGNPRSSYVTFDLINNVINFKRIKYDIDKVHEKFNDTDLPKEFSLRLSQGR